MAEVYLKEHSSPIKTPKQLITIVLLAFVAALAYPAELRAQSALQREYEIKAAYLYNFINYIDWPADALPAAGGAR